MASIDRVKVTIPVWDSDKNPNEYRKWSSVLSGMVRSCKGGLELESYREEKMGITSTKAKIVPTYILSDPDFSPSDTTPMRPSTSAVRREVFSPGDIGPKKKKVDKEDEEIVIETPISDPLPLNTPRSSTRVISPGISNDQSYYRASRLYKDLSKEARELDNHIYSVMVMNIKGAKAELLEHVTFASYVQVSLILWKHFEISRNTRKTDALEAMSNLKLTDSVQTWAIDSVKAFQELKESNVTIEDFGLMCLVKSLDGKSKYVQHEIVKDINLIEDKSQIQIFDVVEKYASAMASVDGIKPKSTNQVATGGDDDDAKLTAEQIEAINAVKDFRCHTCGKQGHFANKCPDKDKPSNGRPGSEKPFPFKCAKCGKKGHKKRDCPNKDDKANGDGSKPALSSGDLLKMMDQLKGGHPVKSVTVAQLTEMEVSQMMQEFDIVDSNISDSVRSTNMVSVKSYDDGVIALVNGEWVFMDEVDTLGIDIQTVMVFSVHPNCLGHDCSSQPIVCDCNAAVACTEPWGCLLTQTMDEALTQNMDGPIMADVTLIQNMAPSLASVSMSDQCPMHLNVLCDCMNANTDLQGLSTLSASAPLVPSMEELVTACEVGRSKACTLTHGEMVKSHIPLELNMSLLINTGFVESVAKFDFFNNKVNTGPSAGC